MSTTSKELYYWYKENGRCPRCGGAPVRGKVHCIDCLDMFREKERKRRAKWTEDQTSQHNEQQKKYHKDLYEQRKAAGLCVKCGKRKAYRTLMCGICQNKFNKSRREKHRDSGGMTYEERSERERCYFCGAPALEGKRTCAKCYEREKIIAQNMRNHIKLSGFKKTRELFW